MAKLEKTERDKIEGPETAVGSVVAAVFLLLVLEVAELLRQGDEVGEGHPAEADVIEGLNGAGLDVLSVVAVEAALNSVLQVAYGEKASHRHARVFRCSWVVVMKISF
ncbi:4-hydroxy-tetrahydrodipicolinate reductase [Striga asiatica]|uniref:4-hydroxy-tetrahydrodipicolinate reductase n=1 Tax=Striga asiatica TaxID=4170 RepID=A0A5A7R8B4_STRAF|nr:4-hydroxy-tetrahydrodipicolinate reductase [Striga asiatica]